MTKQEFQAVIDRLTKKYSKPTPNQNSETESEPQKNSPTGKEPLNNEESNKKE